MTKEKSFITLTPCDHVLVVDGQLEAEALHELDGRAGPGLPV